MGKASKGFNASQAAAVRSAGKNTPADVLEAFFPEKITAAEFQIQPVNLATFMALEKIGSLLTRLSEIRTLLLRYRFPEGVTDECLLYLGTQPEVTPEGLPLDAYRMRFRLNASIDMN